jgi:hypothetical protein
VVVVFAPTAGGIKTTTLSLNYYNNQANQTTSLSIEGMGVNATTPVYFAEVRQILSTSCASCHNADWGSTHAALLAFRSSGETTSAIVPGDLSSRFVARIIGSSSEKPQMGVGAYGSLSSSDRDKILAWIQNGAPNNPTGVITQSFVPVIGDRYYIASVMRKIYGTEPRPTAIISTMSERADTLGSPCHAQDTILNRGRRVKLVPFEDECALVTADATRREAELTPQSSSVGESLRMSTCLRLANDTSLTRTALRNIGLESTTPFSPEAVNKAYEQFYPGRAPASSVTASLQAIGQEALSHPGVKPPPGVPRTLESWRFVLMTLCLSPGWQAP